MILYIQLLTIFICAITMLIAFAPLCNMEKGLAVFCHKVKYVLIMASNTAIIFYTTSGYLHLGMLLFSLTLFSVVWPRIVWWYRYKLPYHINNLICWWRYSFLAFFKMPVSLGWILWFLAVVLIIGFGKAHADELPKPPPTEPTRFDEEVPKQPKLGHYNTAQVICADTNKGTELHGKGGVAIWLNDEYYYIDIYCK